MVRPHKKLIDRLANAENVDQFIVIDNNDTIVMNPDFSMRLFYSLDESLAYVMDSVSDDHRRADGYRIVKVTRMYATDLTVRLVPRQIVR
jgi:hypothetical protein